MQYIKFKKNWNNKLNCDIYTTIRQYNTMYREGSDVEVRLNGKFIHNAEIISIKTTDLGHIPNLAVMVDTGYGYDESIEMFRRFFKAKTTWDALITSVDLIHLRKIKQP